MPPPPSSRLAGEKKWHVSRYPKPPNTLMTLGSILKNPGELESSLNYENGIPPFPPEKIQDETSILRLAIKTDLMNSVGGGLKALFPASPLVNVGASVGANKESKVTGSVEASNIRARVILEQTAKGYMDRALQDNKVLEYVRSGIFGGKSLYVIVGVATCNKLSITEGASQQTNASASANVSAPGIVDASAGLNTSKSAMAGSEREATEDCDFAFRVKEFHYSKHKKAWKEPKDVTVGAMYAVDKDGKNTPKTSEQLAEEEEYIPEFERFLADQEVDDKFDGLTLSIT